MISSTLSSFFNQIAVLWLTKYSAFSSSWPGIGFITTIGNPEARLSEVVSPPGFVTTKLEILINSGTLFVYSNICTFASLWFSITIFSKASFIFLFFPEIAMIWISAESFTNVSKTFKV